MSVEPTSQIIPGFPSSTVAPPDTKLDQEDFLQVLVSQLSNQDPGNAMDSNAMMEQFVMMANYEAMLTMSGNSEKLYNQQQFTLATSLVGKTVEVKPPEGSFAWGVVEAASVVDGNVVIRIDGVEYNQSDIIQIVEPQGSQP